MRVNCEVAVEYELSVVSDFLGMATACVGSVHNINLGQTIGNKVRIVAPGCVSTRIDRLCDLYLAGGGNQS